MSRTCVNCGGDMPAPFLPDAEANERNALIARLHSENVKLREKVAKLEIITKKNQHNLIKLRQGKDWHIWNIGSFWPICDPEQQFPADPDNPAYPLFRKAVSSYTDNRKRSVCLNCLDVEKRQGCRCDDD